MSALASKSRDNFKWLSSHNTKGMAPGENQYLPKYCSVFETETTRRKPESRARTWYLPKFVFRPAHLVKARRRKFIFRLALLANALRQVSSLDRPWHGGGLKRWVAYNGTASGDAACSWHILSCKARFPRHAHHVKASFACRIKFGMASSYFLTWINHNNS